MPTAIPSTLLEDIATTRNAVITPQKAVENTITTVVIKSSLLIENIVTKNAVINPEIIAGNTILELR